MGRRVRFFTSQIAKEKDVIPIRSLYECAPLVTVGPRAAHTMDELDTTLAEHEERLTTMNESYQTLGERTRELIEARHVLRETAVFFEQVRSRGFQRMLISHFTCRHKDTGLKFAHHLTILSHPFFKRTGRLVTFLATFHLTLSSFSFALVLLFSLMRTQVRRRHNRALSYAHIRAGTLACPSGKSLYEPYQYC